MKSTACRVLFCFVIGFATVVHLARAQDQFKLLSQPGPGPQTATVHVPLEGAALKSSAFLKIEPLAESSGAQAKAGPRSPLTISRERLAEPALLQPGDERARELSRAMQSRLGSTLTPDQVRSLLNAGSRQTPERLATMKNAGKAVLDADRARLGATAIKESARPTSKELDQRLPRKLPLQPLPEKASGKTVACERTARSEELRAKANSETNSAARERLLLVLAGNHVGENDWLAARAIYEQLGATSNDPAVLEAVRRNLRVVDKKLEALAERDPRRREELELELAAIHQDLGHEQAAKRICRELMDSAHDESVRKAAATLHDAETRPNQLPLPPGLSPPGHGGAATSCNAANGGAR